MEIREVRENELKQLLDLYLQLGENNDVLPDRATEVWEEIGKHPGYHILVAVEEGKLLSSCTLAILPNLTHGHRPYGLIENVVTERDYRKRGLASACLAQARKMAESQGCYKLMLLTGSRQETTLRFYERAGYRSDIKTAFALWL